MKDRTGTKKARLLIEPFQPLATSIRAELTKEGERLLRWVYDDAEAFEIQIVEA